MVTEVEHSGQATAVLPRQRPLPGSTPYKRVVAPESATPRGNSFRPDVEGLRAIAVVSVVLYHFHFLGFSGGYVGVDIFFVISGFLITRQLSERMADPLLTRGRAVVTFYAGRFRRLMPAAGLTIAATLILTKLYAPPLQQKSIFTDGIFASLYSLNYRLAVQGTDYMHIGDAASPLQHFWSLAVEEQFYFFWPAIMAGVFFVFRSRWSWGLTAVLASVGIASFIGCYYVTNSSQPWAYFSLWTRAWELAAGAIIAVVMRHRKGLPRVVSEILSAVGVIAIVYSVFVYTDSTVFPGVAAAVPVGGAALVILGGSRSGLASTRLLGWTPMRFIGKISYSWYLWHWPLLILAPSILGHALSVPERIVLLVATFLIATQSFWIIEQPTRLLSMITWKWLSFGVVGAVVLSLFGATLVALQPAVRGSGTVAAVAPLTANSTDAANRVANLLTASISTKHVPANLEPTLQNAPNDVLSDHTNGCHEEYAGVTPPACVYGDTTGKQTAVLFGDSHMEQWFPGFDVAGKTDGWKIVNWTKSGCGFTDVSIFDKVLNRIYTECDEWRTAIIKRIIALHPSIIFMSGAEDLADGQVSDAAWVADSAKTLKMFTSAGLKVTFIDDTVRATSIVPDCLASNLNSAQRCTFSTASGIFHAARHAALAAAMKAGGATVVDPEPWMCALGTCPVIVGNLLVYRDDNHLTATYSRWLAPVLAELLRK